MLSHIKDTSKEHIHIIVDCDVDGYASAAIMYMYLKQIEPQLKITYSIHTGKLHGITKEIKIPKSTTLLIVPDAGTSDTKQCQFFKEKNIDVLILDHHIPETDNKYATIVNNQCCEYPNKQLCGVGIVYKFLLALDDELWENYADNYLDLVSLGNIADMMDIREYETKYLIDCGLKHIKNKLFKALIIKQEDSIHNVLTIHNMQFYIVPLINALIRVGKQEDKELLFQAFVENDKWFDYKPRKASKTIREDIYSRVACICVNAKAKQKRAMDKAIPLIQNQIDVFELSSVIVLDVSNILEQGLAGLLANKIAQGYKKPCLVLHNDSCKDQKNNDYIGSGRNYQYNVNNNLRNSLLNTNKFEFAKGHPNAFGCKIKEENVQSFIQLYNENNSLSDNTMYYIDYIIEQDELSISFISQIERVKQYCGQNIDEPLIMVKNITIHRSEFTTIGKLHNHWRCELENGVVLTNFNIDKSTDILYNTFDEFSDEEEIMLNIIGKCGYNYYNGIITCQMIIDDYEVV